MTIDQIRIDELKSLCLMTGQPDAFPNMLLQFIESLFADQIKLKMLTGGDLEKALHTLKGRCGTFGAIALLHAIDEAERAPLRLRDSAFNEVSLVLTHTIEAFKQLLISLKSDQISCRTKRRLGCCNHGHFPDQMRLQRAACQETASQSARLQVQSCSHVLDSQWR